MSYRLTKVRYVVSPFGARSEFYLLLRSNASGSVKDTICAIHPTKTKHFFDIVAVIFFLLSIATVPVSAQPATRNLRGTVTDTQQEPLQGAIVEIENEVTLTVSSFITNRSGSYRFLRLDPDCDYAVWATYRDHRSHMRHISRFDSSEEKVYPSGD